MLVLVTCSKSMHPKSKHPEQTSYSTKPCQSARNHTIVHITVNTVGIAVYSTSYFRRVAQSGNLTIP